MRSPLEMLGGNGDEELDRLLEQFHDEVTGFEELQRNVSEVRGRGEAAQGRVTAETSLTGALTGLTIDPRAMRLSSGELAEAILRAAGEAARDAGEQTRRLVDPFVTGTPLETVLPPRDRG